MSDDLIEYVATQTGPSRRQFLTRLLAGAAFVTPVVASYAIGRGSSVQRRPLEALGSNVLADCGPNTLDLGANSSPRYVDLGANGQVDLGGNTGVINGQYCQMPVDGGSNSVDTGSNTGDQGSGAGIPPTK